MVCGCLFGLQVLYSAMEPLSWEKGGQTQGNVEMGFSSVCGGEGGERVEK